MKTRRLQPCRIYPRINRTAGAFQAFFQEKQNISRLRQGSCLLTLCGAGSFQNRGILFSKVQKGGRKRLFRDLKSQVHSQLSTISQITGHKLHTTGFKLHLTPLTLLVSFLLIF